MTYRAILAAAALALLLVACDATPTPPAAPATPTWTACGGRLYPCTPAAPAAATALLPHVYGGRADGVRREVPVSAAYPAPTATEEAGYP